MKAKESIGDVSSSTKDFNTLNTSEGSIKCELTQDGYHNQCDSSAVPSTSFL